MGRDRSGQRKGDLGRVPGGFVALPYSVVDSPAWAAASSTDRALLIEIARQCMGDNNGRLLASRAYLAGRGWKSAGVIHRSTQNLLALGLIHQTVQGHRPNKASWFAVTWRLLDPHPDYDRAAAATFVRGSYLNVTPAPVKRRKPPQRAIKNAGLSPMVGTARAPIAPLEGTEQGGPCPLGGPVRAPKRTPPVPPKGHPLETPSARHGPRPSVGMKSAKVSTCAPALGAVIERVRDCDLDPARFDPISGECLPAPVTPTQVAKREAAAFVTGELRRLGKLGALDGADLDDVQGGQEHEAA